MNTGDSELIPNLFRTEYSKLVAVLCKVFGIQHIQVAEDIVSDTFLLAAETWGKKGIPDNQVAWLYTVAKNRARDYLRKEKIRKEKVEPFLQQKEDRVEISLDFAVENIQDSQLRMLFALCHPSLKQADQVILSLRILCGFGIEEIGSALLSTKDKINKRLFRAKKSLRSGSISLDFPSTEEIPNRLDSVLLTLYLLFNEGYYSKSNDPNMCKDFCLEAMRLALLLNAVPLTHSPKVAALISLMCFHTSRFGARYSEEGEFILFQDQNREMWDQDLIKKGEYFLNLASTGEQVSTYHLEAAIAFWHTQPEDKEKWENILQLYNYLLQVSYSPLVALNRTFALAKANGIEEGLKEALKLNQDENPLYHCLLAEFYQGSQDGKASEHLQKALKLSHSERERNLMKRRLDSLEE
ncbi:MAG: sigma-70 family RNA polymerase sigma factor [Bacteroidota bacterium]